jgi:predicted kinase
MENNPTAYIMVGAPGSGKSTYAAKLAQTENAFIISGDDIRKELFGSAEVIGEWVEIHDRIEEEVASHCHQNIVLDCTHYRKEYREEAVSLVRSYGFNEVEAVVMDASLATCLARNFMREDRNVPDYVVKGMHEQLQKSLKGIFDEGFTRTHFIY